MQIKCLFCGEDLFALYASLATETAAACPRCGARVVFSTDLSDISTRLAEIVYDTDLVRAATRARLEVRIQPEVDVLLDDPGGQVVATVSLAVAWDPAEELNTTQVGAILGVTRERVSRICHGPDLPGAWRQAPSRPALYKLGRWSIPRGAVWELMQQRRNVTAER